MYNIFFFGKSIKEIPKRFEDYSSHDVEEGNPSLFVKQVTWQLNDNKHYPLWNVMN